MADNKISTIRHPAYNLPDWTKFRLVMEGGSRFINAYLATFSQFEQRLDYEERKKLTYNPGHAAGVVKVTKNAIFQRLIDVTREGGPDSYVKAVKGANGGVDKKNRGMNSFLGDVVLPEMLGIRKVGVYVDMPIIPEGASQAETVDKTPYVYPYCAEDILSWEEDNSSAPGRFSKLLLRDTVVVNDDKYDLPKGIKREYRLIKKIPGIGVSVNVYDEEDNIVRTQILAIQEIPFVLFDLDYSLLQDIADYQIVALNLASSDSSFLFKSNFPVYTEQYDPKWESSIRKAFPAQAGTMEQARGGHASDDTLEGRVTKLLETESEANKEGDMVAGVGRGRSYGKGLERPAFINPSSEPVKASMEKQKHMADEIRILADLALSSLAARYASGESKKLDREGLEAGLSYIGLVCERGENEIARLWAMYESATAAKVSYPTNYSLKTEKDRREEAKEYIDLNGAVTSKTYSKHIQKRIAQILLAARLTPEDIELIYKEIEEAKGVTSDPETIKLDIDAGLVSNETASALRGYDEGEWKKAEADHARRAARIAQAQSDAANRGVMDMSKDIDAPKKEKEASKDTTMHEETEERVRS